MRALLAILIAASLAGAAIQQEIPQFENPYVVMTDQGPTLPDINFTLAEVLSILADYEVHHSRDIETFGYHGLAIHKEHRIVLATQPSHADRVETLIGELLHIAYYRRDVMTNDQLGDKIVHWKARQIHRQIYGIPKQ